MTSTASGPEGIVVVDKPAGLTSHDVVAVARRALGTRRVGHAGTLDPMATGVLVLGAGRATRLLGYLSGHGKTYEATIVLGASTDTDDAEGTVIARTDASAVDDSSIDHAITSLTGDLDQVPSAVSAVKVDGRRAHALVRAGESVALAPRPVTVTRFDVRERRRAGDRIELDVVVDCSAGTYVRALARDLGAALGVGGHLTALRRARSGPFGLEGSTDLAALRPASLIDMAQAAAVAFPSAVLGDDEAAAVRHGRQVAWPASLPRDVSCALMAPDGALLAVAREREGRAAYAAVLAEP